MAYGLLIYIAQGTSGVNEGFYPIVGVVGDTTKGTSSFGVFGSENNTNLININESSPVIAVGSILYKVLFKDVTIDDGKAKAIDALARVSISDITAFAELSGSYTIYEEVVSDNNIIRNEQYPLTQSVNIINLPQNSQGALQIAYRFYKMETTMESSVSGYAIRTLDGNIYDYFNQVSINSGELELSYRNDQGFTLLDNNFVKSISTIRGKYDSLGAGYTCIGITYDKVTPIKVYDVSGNLVTSVPSEDYTGTGAGIKIIDNVIELHFNSPILPGNYWLHFPTNKFNLYVGEDDFIKSKMVLISFTVQDVQKLNVEDVFSFNISPPISETFTELIFTYPKIKKFITNVPATSAFNYVFYDGVNYTNLPKENMTMVLDANGQYANQIKFTVPDGHLLSRTITGSNKIYTIYSNHRGVEVTDITNEDRTSSNDAGENVSTSARLTHRVPEQTIVYTNFDYEQVPDSKSKVASLKNIQLIFEESQYVQYFRDQTMYDSELVLYKDEDGQTVKTPVSITSNLVENTCYFALSDLVTASGNYILNIPRGFFYRVSGGVYAFSAFIHLNFTIPAAAEETTATTFFYELAKVEDKPTGNHIFKLYNQDVLVLCNETLIITPVVSKKDYTNGGLITQIDVPDASCSIKVNDSTFTVEYKEEKRLEYSAPEGFISQIDNITVTVATADYELSKSFQVWSLNQKLFDALRTGKITTEAILASTINLSGGESLEGSYLTLYPTYKYDRLEQVIVEGVSKPKAILEGNTKVRLGNLSGIYNDLFGTKQPFGYGLYGENVFLTGNFYLNNGKSLMSIDNDLRIIQGDVARTESLIDKTIKNIQDEREKQNRYLSRLENLVKQNSEDLNAALEAVKSETIGNMVQGILAENKDAFLRQGLDFSLWALGNAGIALINQNAEYDFDGNVKPETVGDGDEYVALMGDSVHINTPVSISKNGDKYIQVYIIYNTNSAGEGVTVSSPMSLYPDGIEAHVLPKSTVKVKKGFILDSTFRDESNKALSTEQPCSILIQPNQVEDSNDVSIYHYIQSGIGPRIKPTKVVNLSPYKVFQSTDIVNGSAKSLFDGANTFNVFVVQDYKAAALFENGKIKGSYLDVDISAANRVLARSKKVDYTLYVVTDNTSSYIKDLSNYNFMRYTTKGTIYVATSKSEQSNIEAELLLLDYVKITLKNFAYNTSSINANDDGLRTIYFRPMFRVKYSDRYFLDDESLRSYYSYGEEGTLAGSTSLEQPFFDINQDGIEPNLANQENRLFNILQISDCCDSYEVVNKDGTPAQVQLDIIEHPSMKEMWSDSIIVEGDAEGSITNCIITVYYDFFGFTIATSTISAGSLIQQSN